MRKILFVLFILLFCQNIFPLDTAAVKFFPLQTGNKWIYIYTEHPSGYSHIMHWDITGTTAINGHVYYLIDEYYTNRQFTSMIRFDSALGCIKKYSSSPCLWLNNEINMDSLSSGLNDSSTYNCDIRYRCNDTSTVTIFNIVYKKKGFYAVYDFGYRIRTFARNIGLVNTFSAGMSGTYSTVLKGCVLNGVVYGDTSLVTVNPVSSYIPTDFSLSQNYPNPFNPVTKIKFSIPQVEVAFMRPVQLMVYDVLGKEIAVLVNQQLQSGTYEADWDASSFPGGVYFYKLVAGNSNLETSQAVKGSRFSETKKMVLIK